MEGISHSQESTTRVQVNQQAKSRTEDQVNSRLTPVEKATFGIAAAFSTLILVACILLTIIGFIFSPIADTLVFALLMIATGSTSYVIWRGGKRNAA